MCVCVCVGANAKHNISGPRAHIIALQQLQGHTLSVCTITYLQVPITAVDRTRLGFCDSLVYMPVSAYPTFSTMHVRPG